MLIQIVSIAPQGVVLNETKGERNRAKSAFVPSLLCHENRFYLLGFGLPALRVVAGNAAESQRILNAWDAPTRAYAGLNLGFDYLFIVSYVGAIGLGCSLLAVNLRPRFRALAHIGITLAWGQLLAAAFDSLENIALLKLLLGSEQAAWAAVARACEIPKFLIVLLGLLYLLVALVFAFAWAGRHVGAAVRH